MAAHVYTPKARWELPVWDWAVLAVIDQYLSSQLDHVHNSGMTGVMCEDGQVQGSAVPELHRAVMESGRVPKSMFLMWSAKQRSDEHAVVQVTKSEFREKNPYSVNVSYTGPDRDQAYDHIAVIKRRVEAELARPGRTSDFLVAAPTAELAAPEGGEAVPAWRKLLPDLHNVRDNLWSNVFWAVALLLLGFVATRLL